jgi:hypothetical protein
MPMQRRLSLLFSVLVAAAGCGTSEEVCAGLSVSELRPGVEHMIRVGETFTAEYRVGDTCYGRPMPDLGRAPVRWVTADSAIVRVDSVSGRVRGLARGEAIVWARYPDAPPDPDQRVAAIRVHVQ